MLRSYSFNRPECEPRRDEYQLHYPFEKIELRLFTHSSPTGKQMKMNKCGERKRRTKESLEEKISKKKKGPEGAADEENEEQGTNKLTEI